ncbi:hypothetical protein MTO96_005554 [Rhipicephalus appendiculatus]
MCRFQFTLGARACSTFIVLRRSSVRRAAFSLSSSGDETRNPAFRRRSTINRRVDLGRSNAARALSGFGGAVMDDELSSDGESERLLLLSCSGEL